MKTFKYAILPSIALFVMAGCKDDPAIPQPTGSDGFTVTASIDGDLNAVWEPGDEIKIVCADEIYTFVTAEGGATATFADRDDRLSAAMIGNNPVTGYANCSSMYGTFRIQTEQLVNDGVNAARVPMFAYTMNPPQSNGLTLAFKPLGSLLELEVEPYDVVAERLVITPARGAVVSGGAMAGGYTVDAAKSVVTLTNPVNSITLEFVGGMDLSAGATLNIPVGWFAIEGGLDLVFQQGARSYASTLWTDDGLVRTFTDGTGFKQARLIQAKYEFDANAFPRAYYVKAGAASAARGLTWEAPSTLEYAIANAAPGSTIHIAAGTYTPSATLPGRDESGQTKTFEFSRNVAVIGGYPADAATGAVSDPSANETVFDGGGSSFHTVVVSAPKVEGEKVGLKGVTIRGGRSSSGDLTPTGINGIALGDNYGAGIALVGTCAELVDCTITENEGHNGAGLYAAGSEVTIEGCKFPDNTASATGGGAMFTAGSEVSMDSSVFDGNTAGTGGGLYLHAPAGGSLAADIKNTTVSGSKSTATASALYIQDDSGSHALVSSFTDCTITGSTTTATGDMGGTAKILNARTSFTRCTISDNTATNNGMFCVTTSGTGTARVTFDGCRFTGNSTVGAAVAAGIYAYTAGGVLDMYVFNSTFAGNTAAGRGGGIYARSGADNATVGLICVNTTFSGNKAGSHGSAITMNSTAARRVNTTLISCTVTGNEGTHGTANGAISAETAGSSLTTHNTIVSGNIPQDVHKVNASAVISHYNTFVGAQFYDAAGTVQTVSPAFDASTMLSPLADNGGDVPTHKLTGAAATNPAFGNGMTATALKAMATDDIPADVLGEDATGTARTDAGKIAGACVK